MPKQPKKAWYGVRSLYRITAEDKPKSRDKHFDPDSTLIEDRIVLLQATSFDDAIAQAVKEARAYCKGIRMVNIYGQKVVTRFLEACDAYEIVEGKPTAGAEVYSSTELFRASASDTSLIKRRLGTPVSANRKARYKFMDGPTLSALRSTGLDKP